MKPWNHRRNADMEGHNGSRKEDFWNGILWCFLHKKKPGDSFHSWPSGGMIRWPFGQLVKWPHLVVSCCNFEVSLLTAQFLFRKSHLMSCHQKRPHRKGCPTFWWITSPTFWRRSFFLHVFFHMPKVVVFCFGWDYVEEHWIWNALTTFIFNIHA